jgi:hypothetical protein
MMMSAEPVYNKMGDVVGCTDGRTFLPGSAPVEDPCGPPPGDECNEPTFGTAAAPYGCPEPGDRDDDDDGGRQPNDPTTGAG